MIDNELQEFLVFTKEMLESNSRLHKVSVLEKYKNSDSVRYFLNFVFDPYKVTGLSIKKLNKQLPPQPTAATTAKQMLEYILKNNTGKDEVIAKTQYFLFANELDDEQIELFYRIVDKNLPIGVDVLTINKVMPGLIPTFSVQLANKYFDKPEVVEGKSFTITTKIDGGRIIALKKNGIVKFYTRAGQEYEGLVDIKAELEAMEYDNFALDGEITLLDKGTLNSKEQYKETMKITRKDGEKHGVKILAFDLMDAYDFEAQLKTLDYVDRRRELELRFPKSMKYVEVLPVLYTGNDTSMIGKLLDQQTAKGEEGIMININDEPYSFTRSNALLKVKKMKDADLKVIRLEEGTNQNAGKLGAFVVDYKGFEVKVGSGIPKEIREKVWADKDSYIGMTIAVQYFEETTNQSGGLSLRFPVFLDFRYDK